MAFLILAPALYCKRANTRERLSANLFSIEPFHQKLKVILITDKTLLLSQVYNCNKTGLSWKSIPQSQAYRIDNSTPGRKVYKQRLSAP